MGRRVSDGRSVRVTLPASSVVPQGAFALVQGWLGWAPEGATTGSAQTASLILVVEQAEYETSQLDVAQAYNVGDLVFWDPTNNRFTTATGVTGARRVGRVTSAKDANNVIWIGFLGEVANSGL
jgi:Uncharacterized conserved protein (DUF2190)